MIERTILTEKVLFEYTKYGAIYVDKHHYFDKYIAENGHYVCTVNDEVVSREEGNEIFKNLKSKAKKYSVTKETILKNDAEILEYLDGSIDKYYMYIDNGKQYNEAVEHNEKIYKIIRWFKVMMSEGE